jgi:predicted outer membrane repeat protein
MLQMRLLRLPIKIPALCAIMLLSGIVSADVINVPGDYITIQAGINAASDGDTVLVADGTYSGFGNINMSFGGRDIVVRSESGPEACIIDCLGVNRAFTFVNGEPRSARLEGFTVTNGRAENGGAVYCEGATPTIAGNIFTGNSAEDDTSSSGGAIYCCSCTPIIRNNLFSGNQSVRYGGAVSFYQAYGGFGLPAVEGNLFEGNSSQYGGALYVVSSELTLSGNRFIGNTAQYYGGGLHGRPTYTLRVVGNLFAANQAGSGGGVALFGGNTPRTVEFSDNVVRENSCSSYGGGLYGGGEVALEMTNCLVIGNRAEGRGGAVAVRYESTLHLRNCTVWLNRGAQAGGVYIERRSSGTIANSILWGNEGLPGRQLALHRNSTAYLNHTDIEGGQDAVHRSEGCWLSWQGGMIDADPLFTGGPLGNCYLAQTAAGQPADSPCLDAGNGEAAGTCFSGAYAAACFDQYASRTDQVVDHGVVDLGYHHPGHPEGTVAAAIVCSPPAGTLPFAATAMVELKNRCPGSPRRLAARLDFYLANGRYYSNWRVDVLALAAGERQSGRWTLDLPDIPAFQGLSTGVLVVHDVTPAPYNQPPYPPSGATATDSFTVTGE